MMNEQTQEIHHDINDHDDDDDDEEEDDEEDDDDDDDVATEAAVAGNHQPSNTTSTAATATNAATTTTTNAATTTNASSATNSSTSNAISSLTVAAVSNLDALYGLREMGREALCWQLSSAKPGNGVEQIRDQSTDTYWQSDGMTQPHIIQVHFARRVAISHVCLYLDYNLDESYTPKTIAVHSGMTCTQDLIPAIVDNATVELHEPVGWVIIPLTAPPDPLDDILLLQQQQQQQDQRRPRDHEHHHHTSSSSNIPRRIVRTHLLQIEICAMHQNGRDTHVRQGKQQHPLYQ
jgi:anaphase-promoting complex subunit 10